MLTKYFCLVCTEPNDKGMCWQTIVIAVYDSGDAKSFPISEMFKTLRLAAFHKFLEGLPQNANVGDICIHYPRKFVGDFPKELGGGENWGEKEEEL